MTLGLQLLLSNLSHAQRCLWTLLRVEEIMWKNIRNLTHDTLLKTPEIPWNLLEHS